MSTTSSNQKASSARRSIASSDETNTQPVASDETATQFNYTLDSVSSNPKMKPYTYVPPESIFKIDEELLTSQSCKFGWSRKNLDDHTTFNHLFHYCKLPLKNLPRPPRYCAHEFSTYTPVNSGLADLKNPWMTYDSQKRTIVTGPYEDPIVPDLYARSFTTIDPSSMKPQALIIEWRLGPQKRFRDKALQARFTCAPDISS